MNRIREQFIKFSKFIKIHDAVYSILHSGVRGIQFVILPVIHSSGSQPCVHEEKERRNDQRSHREHNQSQDQHCTFSTGAVLSPRAVRFSSRFSAWSLHAIRSGCSGWGQVLTCHPGRSPRSGPHSGFSWRHCSSQSWLSFTYSASSCAQNEQEGQSPVSLSLDFPPVSSLRSGDEGHC